MAGQQGGYSLGRKHRRLDDWALRLWGDVAPGAEKPTFLYIDFRYGMNEEFRDIEIGMNFRKQGKEGKIKCFPDQAVFFAMTKKIKDMVDFPDRYPVGFTRMYDNMSNFMGGKRVDQPFSDIKLVVGKDEQGIWICLSKKGYDKVKCYFNAPMSWVLRDGEGRPLTAFDQSCEMAFSIVSQWEDNIQHVLNHQYLGDDNLQAAKDKKKADAFSGRQGGGGQQGGGKPWQQQQQGGGQQQGGWGGGNGGGQSNPSTQSFDNDLPF